MSRECYVLEDYDRDTETWSPILAAPTRDAMEVAHAKWPDTAANPKRIVRYVPDTEEKP